jgi:hypothetical protein
MGAAILITLGVLFLLDNYGIFYFDNTWPVLLIVIGVLSFAARNAPTEGHIQRYSVAPSQNNPGQGAAPGQSGPGPEVKS